MIIRISSFPHAVICDSVVLTCYGRRRNTVHLKKNGSFVRDESEKKNKESYKHPPKCHRIPIQSNVAEMRLNFEIGAVFSLIEQFK